MKALRILSSAVLIAVIAVSGFVLEKKLNEYRLADEYKVSVTKEYKKANGVDFDKLKARNKDVVGWIRIPDTRVDYPVVQGEDNKYYLHRNLDGNYVYDGTIFVDAAVEQPFESYSTVIYGHRMASGAMFAAIKYYKDADFMKKHPVVYVETPDKTYELTVVAFCGMDADTEIYTTDFYDGLDEAYAGALSKDAFVDLIRAQALVRSGEPFSSDDRFAVLSTCKRSSGNGRLQLVCTVHEVATEGKVQEKISKNSDQSSANKWLLCQIGVGIVCLGLIALNIKKK